MSRNAANGSVGLEQVREQLAHWRRTPQHGRAIPEEIWESVVALAKVHGLNPIVREFGLNYDTLKKRLTSRSRGKLSSLSTAASGPVFLDLGFGGVEPASGSGCTVELKAADGSSMSLRLSGTNQPDLVALAAAFWSRRS